MVEEHSARQTDSAESTAPVVTKQQQQQQPPRTKPQWRQAVAGAGAGAVSRTLLAPVERVKLLQQLQGSVHLGGPHSAVAVARKIYTEEGFWAFWRGNLPNVLRVSGTSAINFTCMDYYKRAAVAPIIERFIVQRHAAVTAQQIERRRKLATSFISGGLAGATATTILYPIEFVRTRLAMDLGVGGGTSGNVKPRQYTGMRDVMRSIIHTDGVLGFYQGYGIALVGGVVYRIILLGGYDAWKGELLFRKKRLQRQGTETKVSLSWGERIVSAQIISLTAGTVAYPFDSVRRRMMMQSGRQDRLYRNSIHCIRTVWSAEGLRGFYLGLGPNLLRSIGSTLLLVGYDRILSLLQ